MPQIITKGIVTPKGLIEFRFEPLTISGNTIFAVYCAYGGTPHCFHMAIDTGTNDYKIMDKQNCPYEFHDLEQLLSEAIHGIES